MRRSRLLAVPALLGVAALASCAQAGAAGGGLRIAAAASLQGAFDELVAEFEVAHPDILVAPVVYDGSSTLATQIAEGAPVDVAAFADEPTMARISDDAEEPRIFATNSLVVAVPEGRSEVASLDDLADPGLDVVLCAPEVPCGAAAQTALEAEGLRIDAASLEQNVSAVATKVAESIADAGLVYRTDVLATEGIVAVEDPRLDDIVNSYPIAATAGAASADDAEAFIDFVLSDPGQQTLAKWGFGTP
ncbi:molybdate ABC transporter substrate-binding protein [Microbacterium sp. G2-8]|uniref:molybdate ABC transporter substrate-binding protein n=1 Tax=Microbacterium sp. G2-8 TaxID=2842454 RepID=UPI001C8979AC|nr:molybdate ABC transporter substrate-binding protein [Microbacterium sp. G2-8]